MSDPLPRRANLFLRSLAEALRPIEARHRDAILLELRGHLLDCWSRGEHRLDEALEGMGAPESFAAGFLSLGAPQPDAAGALVSLPEAAANDPPLVEGLRRTLIGSAYGLRHVGLALFCGLTLTDFAAFAPLGPEGRGTMMAARLLLVLFALVAGYRLMLRSERKPWQPDFATLRFAAASVGTLAIIAAGLVLVRLGLSRLTVRGAIFYLLMAAAFGASSLAALRLQPFLVALAGGRAGFGLNRVWAGMTGRTRQAAALWLIAVFPLFALHFGLSVAARLLPFDFGLHLGIAGLDAIATTAMAMLAMAINVTAFRWVAGESAPTPEPFSTERPAPEEVERQRALLLDHLRQARRLT